jgi:hypothetical protein
MPSSGPDGSSIKRGIRPHFARLQKSWAKGSGRSEATASSSSSSRACASSSTRSDTIGVDRRLGSLGAHEPSTRTIRSGVARERPGAGRKVDRRGADALIGARGPISNRNRGFQGGMLRKASACSRHAIGDERSHEPRLIAGGRGGALLAAAAAAEAAERKRPLEKSRVSAPIAPHHSWKRSKRGAVK